MESDIQIITAVAAITLAVAVVLLTVQIAIWRAFRAWPPDAPSFLVSGGGIMPSALVAATAAGTIALLVL